MAGFYIFGDSNSAIWGSTPRPTEIPWPNRYATRLVGDVAGAQLVRNYAIGGQRMHYCRGQAAQPGVSWPAIETYGPESLAGAAASSTPMFTRAVLCAGTNDVPVEATPDAEIQDLYAAFDIFDETVRDRWGITLYVIGVVPMRVQGLVPQATWNVREPRRQALNQRLRTVFGPSGRYLDPAMLEDSTRQLDARFAYSDGLHVNEFGHDRLTQAIPLAWMS